MATRKLGAVVAEMLEAIEGIERACADKTYDTFRADWLLRHGVQRGIEIISEAARHLPDDVLALRPEVPWAKIRAAGNVLRHEYFRVADDVVWSVVIDELPLLKAAVIAIRDQLKE